MRPQGPNLALFHALFDLLVRVVSIVLSVDLRSADPRSFSALVPRISFSTATIDPVWSAPCGPRDIAPLVGGYVGVPFTERTVVLDGPPLDGLVVLLRLRIVHNDRNSLHICRRCALVAKVPGEGNILFGFERDDEDGPFLQEILILQDAGGREVDIRLRPAARVSGKPGKLPLIKKYLPDRKYRSFFFHCDIDLRKYMIRR